MIIIEDIRYLDKFRPAETDENWLKANIGEPIDIEIDFRVEEVVVNDGESYDDGTNLIVVEPEPYITGIADRERLVWSNNPEIFANFFVGDTIVITGAKKSASNGTFTIAEKINNSAFRVAELTTIPSFLVKGGTVHISTPFNGVRYYNNFIENNSASNFNDIATGNTRLLVTDSADNTNATPVSMVFLGEKDSQIGSATIQGNGSTTYGQRFTIKHSTVLTPLYLESQYNDLLARTKPEYYEAGNCLKNIFQLECNRVLSNPNDNQILLSEDILGNTGWFNENYNGGQTNYSYSNLVITRVSDATTLNALELTNSCDVTFRVTNTTDSPFSASNTQSMAIFWQLPEQSNYIQNGRNLQENYVYDYALNTEGAAAVSGVYGVAIDEFETTYVDADNLDVRIRISIDLTSQGYINENANKRYLLSFMVENHALDRETSDKVNLLLNVNDFTIQLYDTNLITNNTNFLQHPQNTDYSLGLPSLEVFPTDDVLAYSQFSIDFNGLENDGINILRVQHQLLMTKTGEADILLEDNSYNVTASSFLSGYVPIIDLEQNREFRLSDGDDRKLVQVKRDSANDSGTVYAYKTLYPFFIRWETWEALTGVTSPPSGVYDSTLPNNGLNHYWHRYQTLGYNLTYRLKFTIIQNGEQFSQEFDSTLLTHPFNDNADWGNESIKSYDVTTTTELISGGVKFIQAYTNTELVAEFDDVALRSPDINDIDIVFWGIVKESGNIRSVVRYSSVYTDNGSTFFTSIDGSGLVFKEKDVNLYRGKVRVDFNNLPSGDEFTIYARLYDNPPFGCPANGIATESPECILTEDGNNILTEA